MSSRYCAVSAKLKAMHSRFLTDSDYEELLSKKTVTDICAYLKSTPGYGELLEDVNERSIHRGQMEILLESNLADEYVRLYNFVDGQARTLLEFWFMRREVEFLKREIRHIYTHEKRSRDEVNQEKFEAFFRTHTKINREIMHNARSLSDCIEACANTPYAKPLERAQSLESDFFSIGTVLDYYYYSTIWHAASRSLDKEDKALFCKTEGSIVDMLNLMWIYRGKKYFGFPNEIIFTYLLPVRYRLTDDVIRALVAAEGAERFVTEVKNLTPYGALFEGCDEGRFPEENYREIYNKLSKRVFVNHSMSPVAIYAYLNLKEVEINNITTIIEGIRYSLNADAIRGHVNGGGK